MNQASIAGMRVLVAEDEALVVMMLEAMLDELGCVPVGVAAHIKQAKEMLEAHPVDCALLDINLGGESVYPFADLLSQRGTPFIFVTGYDVPDVREDFRHRPVLRKPFDLESLSKALANAHPERRSSADAQP